MGNLLFFGLVVIFILLTIQRWFHNETIMSKTVKSKVVITILFIISLSVWKTSEAYKGKVHSLLEENVEALTNEEGDVNSEEPVKNDFIVCDDNKNHYTTTRIEKSQRIEVAHLSDSNPLQDRLTTFTRYTCVSHIGPNPIHKGSDAKIDIPTFQENVSCSCPQNNK